MELNIWCGPLSDNLVKDDVVTLLHNQKYSSPDSSDMCVGFEVFQDEEFIISGILYISDARVFIQELRDFAPKNKFQSAYHFNKVSNLGSYSLDKCIICKDKIKENDMCFSFIDSYETNRDIWKGFCHDECTLEFADKLEKVLEDADFETAI